MAEEKDTQEICKYGSECYQKNPAHHQKYKHPKKSEDVPESESSKRLAQDKDDVGEKYEKGVSKKRKLENISDDPKVVIKTLYLVEMPEDFFSFYKFCQQINKKEPKLALKSLGLELVGPFDVLEGKTPLTQEKALCHYRYYYDPPEFLTVLKGDDKTGLHYGYFRDDPNQLPVFVASNEANVDCKIYPVAANLFGVLTNIIKKAVESSNPFLKMQLQSIQKRMIKWCKEESIALDAITPEMKARRAAIMAKTFNGIGIVVPFDYKTKVGYRDLPVEDKELKRIFGTICNSESVDFKKGAFSELMEIITYVNIACDEGDFGTSLQLGLDLFSFGGEPLHDLVQQQLVNAYDLLKRHEFCTIIKAHLKNRIKNF